MYCFDSQPFFILLYLTYFLFFIIYFALEKVLQCEQVQNNKFYVKQRVWLIKFEYQLIYKYVYDHMSLF